MTTENLPALAATLTTVQGTVVDNDGLVWKFCSFQAVLVGYDAQRNPVSLSDGSPVQLSQIGVANNLGVILFQVAPNAGITPANTKWRITITPLASSKPFSFDVQINGNVQHIDSDIANNIVSPRWELNGTNYGYDDVEVSPQPSAGSVGVSYLNTTTGSLRVWQGNQFQNASLVSSGNVSAQGSPSIPPASMTIDYNPVGNGDGNPWGRVIASSPASSNVAPDFLLIAVSGDTTDYEEFLRYRSATKILDLGHYPNNVAIDANGHLTSYALLFDETTPVTTGQSTLYQYGGGLYIVNFAAIAIQSDRLYFRNSVAAQTAFLDASGNLTVTGNITAASKTFRIPHPIDKEKDLIHACLEGPENAVFYRGESETIDGKAEIDLPDYFETLTHTENRSVLLTQIFEDESIDFIQLAATRIKKGSFAVYSNLSNCKFYWEVKAVRKDIKNLQTEVFKQVQEN